MQNQRLPKAIQNEKQAYKISIISSFILGAIGIIFYFITDSKAILLDGLYSLVNTIISVMTLRVFKKIFQKPNKKFQFGQVQAEPLVNLFKSLTFLGILIMAFFSAIEGILKGGHEMLFGPAVAYSIISVLGGIIIAIVMGKTNKKHPSPLLKVQTIGWIIDAVLSFAVLIVFTAGLLLSDSKFSPYINYLDPILVFIMCFSILPTPIKLLRKNIFELLLSAPPENIQNQIQEEIQKAFRLKKIDLFKIKSTKIGRLYYIHVSALISKDSNLIISDFDDIRKEINQYISEKFNNVLVTIEFTGDKKLYRGMVA